MTITVLPFVYNSAILLSLASNVVIVVFIAKKFGFTKDELFGALFYENAGIILGAKALSYFQAPHAYDRFEIMRLGLSANGAIVGAMLCLAIFGLQYKKTMRQMFFTFMPSIPVMYAIGKVGCFFNGCCYGVVYSGFGSVMYRHSRFAPAEAPVFPVQLVESIVFAGIFIYMIRMIHKNRFDVCALGLGMILSGVAKSALDFLRMSHVGQIISLNQIISIVFVIIGLFLIFRVGVQERSVKK